MYRMKTTLPVLTVVALLLLAACASIGNPDGGRYDEEPPVLVKASPGERATNNKERKISLLFDEYIKLENASEKVVVSPPQAEQPDIKASGKRILITLFDTLQANTTYTVDFADAIVDNNEGNPMGDYTYSFSTGDVIDTMEVSGYVLEARNLEPIKGILVGLHSDTTDTAFTTKPLERVSRTDSRGHFCIKGIAPGSYRVYALKDADQNFIFNQKSEKIGFNHDIIVPKASADIRPDTSWIDSIHYRSIKLVPYTRYTPDNIVLTAFTEQPSFQYLRRVTRDIPSRFTAVFGNKADTLPTIRGLNFDERDAFVIENTPRNDSITYWLKDSAVFNLDTLELAMTYMRTDDSLGILVPQTDTLSLVSKKTRAQIEKERAKRAEEWVKDQKKKMKRTKGHARKEDEFAALPLKSKSDSLSVPRQYADSTLADSALAGAAFADSLLASAPPADSLAASADSTLQSVAPPDEAVVEQSAGKSSKKGKRRKSADSDDDVKIDASMMPADALKMTPDVPEALAPDKNPSFLFEEPLSRIDTAAIHLKLYNAKDSTLVEAPFLLRSNSDDAKKLYLYGEWHPGDEYQLNIDSAAFCGLYGLVTKPFEKKFKIRQGDEFSALFVNVAGADTSFFVQLINQSEEVIKEARTSKNGRVEFYYVEAGKYYLRGYFDRNGNGMWDTGSYADDLQAETVHYYNHALELKKMWEITQDWNLNATERIREKPLEITRQKPEAQKTIKNRNAERERDR